MIYGGAINGSGPSPVIPFVLVSIVAVFIRGPEMELSIDYEMMGTYLLCSIPFLSFLIISFSSNLMIVTPLLFVLVCILLQNLQIGPLVLVVMIHIAAVRYYRDKRRPPCRLEEFPEESPERRFRYDSCNNGSNFERVRGDSWSSGDNCERRSRCDSWNSGDNYERRSRCDSWNSGDNGERRFRYDSCNSSDNGERRFRYDSFNSSDYGERWFRDYWWNSGNGSEDQGPGLGFYLLMLLYFVLYRVYTCGDEDEECGWGGWLSMIALPCFLFFFNFVN